MKNQLIKEFEVKMKERDEIRKEFNYAMKNAVQARAYRDPYDDPRVKICLEEEERILDESQKILNKIRECNERGE